MTKDVSKISKEERILNFKKGKIVEEYVQCYLECQNWNVVNTQINEKGKHYKVLNEWWISKMMQKGDDILSILSRLSCDKYPDFVCERVDSFGRKIPNPEIMFVEVKSNTLNPSQIIQKPALDSLVNRGYKVLLCMIPITTEEIEGDKWNKKDLPERFNFLKKRLKVLSYPSLKEDKSHKGKKSRKKLTKKEIEKLIHDEDDEDECNIVYDYLNHRY